MAIDRYLNLTVLIDGVMQVQAKTVTVNWDPKLNPVELLRGLGGFTPGSKVVTMTVEAAVPISGPEFDAFASAEAGTVHEFMVPVGAKSIVSEGQITSGSVSQSVNDSTSYNFEFMGTYNPPK